MNLHPKVRASVSIGTLATLVVAALALAGITVPPTVVAAVVTIVGFVAGYLTPSVTA